MAGNGTPITELTRTLPSKPAKTSSKQPARHARSSDVNDELKPILMRLVEARKPFRQHEVAPAVGLVSQQALSRIERGEQPLTVELLLHLCRFYSVSSCWVLTGELHVKQGDPL